MSAELLPSQRGTEADVALPYTASPTQLLWSDILLFFKSAWALPGIILPLRPCRSGKLDELYPAPRNLFDIAVHGLLIVYQLAFLLSLPVCILCMVPAVWTIVYAGVAVVLNRVICRIALNGNKRFLVSKVPVVEAQSHEREHWIFINGVAVGYHWLQSNIDRLSYTFGRKITGVHNPTSGIIFDTIQCLIQRNFGYATQDVRDAYPLIKEALLDPQSERVILILHSQGGIEGGLIIDWLLDEMPQELLHHLEVYTFGCAANHFNNPHQSVFKLRQASLDAAANGSLRDVNGGSSTNRHQGKSIGHIEHYANSRDFVSIWGVLNFINIPNRYMGRLFVRPGSGHQFNQHYLDTMFTLGPDGKVLDDNDFMDMHVRLKTSGAAASEERRETLKECLMPLMDNDHQDDAPVPDVVDENSPLASVSGSFHCGTELRVKDLSRLWRYRNGQSPPALSDSA